MQSHEIKYNSYEEIEAGVQYKNFINDTFFKK